MSAANRQAEEAQRSVQDRASSVLADWALGDVVAAEPLRRGQSSADAFRVRVRTGSGEQDLVLKGRADAPAVRTQLRVAHAVIARASAGGVPVAKPLVTASGESQVERDGVLWELMPFIAGGREVGMEVSARHAGLGLARLHAALERGGAIEGVQAMGYHNQRVIVEWIERFWDPDDAWRDAPAARVRALYLEAAQLAAQYGYRGWPKQLLHGDLHRGNMLMNEQGLLAILDFDHVRLGPRMADLANAAVQFAASALRDGRDPLPIVRALTGSYARSLRSAVRPEQGRALPMLMCEAAIGESANLLARLDPDAGAEVRERARRLLERAERIGRWSMEAGDQLSQALVADRPPAGR